jgi:hypothetical protein
MATRHIINVIKQVHNTQGWKKLPKYKLLDKMSIQNNCVINTTINENFGLKNKSFSYYPYNNVNIGFKDYYKHIDNIEVINYKYTNMHLMHEQNFNNLWLFKFLTPNQYELEIMYHYSDDFGNDIKQVKEIIFNVEDT